MQRFYVELGVLLALSAIVTGCTLSFQNISTHGVATDLVDENQAATADVKPVITVPLPTM